MRLQFRDTVIALLKTLAILIVLEVFSTTLVPLIGFKSLRIPFNILVILYLGFKLETPIIGILVVIVQYFHSFFTVEGWEIGTIAGIMISIVVSYLRDMIHLTSFAITVFITQVFQFLWFIIVSGLIYINMHDFQLIISKFWRFIPESIIISLLAPAFFVLLDKIWLDQERGLLGEH